VYINGDGDTSRDFCFIENAVQANILAATARDLSSQAVYNVAVGGRTSLNMLFEKIRDGLGENGIEYHRQPVHRDFRAGDVRHSQADISKIQEQLGYEPAFSIDDGLQSAVPWYIDNL
jgi:UDP-N-acetylglucosamine 4-epimerase